MSRQVYKKNIDKLIKFMKEKEDEKSDKVDPDKKKKNKCENLGSK